MKKFDIGKFGLWMLLSLAFVTIVSSMASQYSNISTLKTGGAFIMLLISIFLVYLFVVVKDGKFDKNEIVTLLIVAVSLLLSAWALKNYFPEIFSILPAQTREVFSAII